MKLILNFDGPSSADSIPYDHQYMVYSGLLNALSSVNSSLSDKLHRANKSPAFVMSQLLGAGTKSFDKEGMLADRYVLLVASRNPEILSEIKKGIEETGKLTAGPLVLPYHSGSILKVTPTSAMPELVTRSPIALKVDGRFIRHGDEGFVKALKSGMLRKHRAITGRDDASIRFFRVLEAKAKLCRVGSAKIPCTHMHFVMDADPDVVRIAMTDGIGSKTQLGFGFIEEVR